MIFFPKPRQPYRLEDRWIFNRRMEFEIDRFEVGPGNNNLDPDPDKAIRQITKYFGPGAIMKGL